MGYFRFLAKESAAKCLRQRNDDCVMGSTTVIAIHLTHERSAARKIPIFFRWPLHARSSGNSDLSLATLRLRSNFESFRWPSRSFSVCTEQRLQLYSDILLSSGAQVAIYFRQPPHTRSSSAEIAVQFLVSLFTITQQ